MSISMFGQIGFCLCVALIWFAITLICGVVLALHVDDDIATDVTGIIVGAWISGGLLSSVIITVLYWSTL